MKETSSLARAPVKPDESSATRKTERVKMQMVERVRAGCGR